MESALLEGRRQAEAARDGGDPLASALDELEEVLVAEEAAAEGGAANNDAAARSSTSSSSNCVDSSFVVPAPPRATHPAYGNNPNKHYLVPIKLLDRCVCFACGALVVCRERRGRRGVAWGCWWGPLGGPSL